MKSLTERLDVKSPSSAVCPPSTSSASAMPSYTAGTLSSDSHLSASRDHTDAALQSDLEEGEERAETSIDREPDATYIEMLQAMKSLLDIPDPECDSSHPPCAFKKRSTARATRRQQSAFPPEENVASMWSYRMSQASGKDANGVIQHEPFNTGHFLPYQRVNMAHYNSVPQSATLKAQQVPQGFSHLHNRSRTPSNVFVPMKQHMLQERILRECIQILERVLHFKRAMAQISANVSGFAQVAKEKDTEDNLDMILTSTSMLDRIIASLELSLDSLLCQNMTLACNMSLARRDTLLYDCHKISSEDKLTLTNTSFTDTELFPSSAVTQAENNVIRRANVPRDNAQPSKRQRRDYDDSNLSNASSVPRAFQSSSSGRGRNATASRGRQSTSGQNSSFRAYNSNKKQQPSRKN